MDVYLYDGRYKQFLDLTDGSFHPRLVAMCGGNGSCGIPLIRHNIDKLPHPVGKHIALRESIILSAYGQTRENVILGVLEFEMLPYPNLPRTFALSVYSAGLNGRMYPVNL